MVFLIFFVVIHKDNVPLFVYNLIETISTPIFTQCKLYFKKNQGWVSSGLASIQKEKIYFFGTYKCFFLV